MNSRAETRQYKGRDISPAMISGAYAESCVHARHAKIYLLISTFLGVYILMATLMLIARASDSPGLITFLNDGASSVETITPHRNPPVTDRQALHWARDKVCDLLSLHFKKYAEQISRRRDYFVGNGWMLYQTSLIESKTIETLKQDGLIITAINQNEPRLLEKYSLDGKTNWRIEMPILQTIQGASDKPQTVKKIASVTVEETRRDHAIEGLKVRIFSVQE